MNHSAKAIEVMDFIQQNMNDEGFINWLHKQLGLGLTGVDNK